MKTYVFNRNEFKWAEEYYDLISQKMKLPEWFGKNADALWDMLTGHIETPCEIVLIGFDKKENEYNALIIQRIHDCFLNAAKEFPDRFKVRFE